MTDDQAAFQLLLKRARRDILSFTTFTKPDYKINWHHKALADKLNAFARGEIKYLMVFMPPRHGKSELVSRRFPAWLHGLYPDCEIMAASYLDLRGDMCIDVQNIIDSDRYKFVFPETKIWPPGTSYTKGTRNSSSTILSEEEASIVVKALVVLLRAKEQTSLSLTIRSKVVKSQTQLHFVKDFGTSIITTYFLDLKRIWTRVAKGKY